MLHLALFFRRWFVRSCCSVAVWRRHLQRHWRRALAGLCASLLLAGAQAQNLLAPLVGASTSAATSGPSQPGEPWRVVGVGKDSIAATRFDLVALDGAPVLRLRTERSYANLVHDLPALRLSPTAVLRWRWRLDQGLPLADLRRKSGDDSPLKVCALFDLPASQLSWGERSLLLLARSLSKETLPGATLCYIWDTQLPEGTVLANAYSQRVRYLVLNGANAPLKQWASHERRLSADFLQAFGHESRSVPPLVAVLVGADADNTGGSSLAYASDLVLINTP